ncbi:hypothetical protein OG552_17535 [Streptomyces sp. NBC_01476]|uniref:hypothetical protein n=1 Tax=Streptomyces sp. NBC_01476 TaxID=2903881 RepID=UPI002E36061A|nr:hypothetical protein [Streptomyces sp. NBC_01476]
MKSQQPSDDQARVRAEGLRRVAVASVAALAVVLVLALATSEHGDGRDAGHRGNAGHSVLHDQAGRGGVADAGGVAGSD